MTVLSSELAVLSSDHNNRHLSSLDSAAVAVATFFAHSNLSTNRNKPKPTRKPTKDPTSRPTKNPTSRPTKPTQKPTKDPTPATRKPTKNPNGWIGMNNYTTV
jgi:hypothetical protein